MISCIIFLFYSSVYSKDQNKKVIEEVINLEDNVVYNIKTDGRGGIEVKTKSPNSTDWSAPKKLDVHENAGKLLENGAMVVKTDDNSFILGYATTIEDFQHKPIQGNYKLDEYNKMANDETTKEAMYQEEPKFVEGVQTTTKSTFYDYKPTEQQKKTASKPPKKKGKKEKTKKAKEDVTEDSETNRADTMITFVTICIVFVTLISF